MSTSKKGATGASTTTKAKVGRQAGPAKRRSTTSVPASVPRASRPGAVKASTAQDKPGIRARAKAATAKRRLTPTVLAPAQKAADPGWLADHKELEPWTLEEKMLWLGFASLFFLLGVFTSQLLRAVF